ncbi:hypothetical protein DSO57_1024591 [Entomophthora muscae]|uniref:Uncharacterized protein n=1 Tax=Entomophthora muscae TaxID=34485 RepID=A0ACC2TPR6_9FUNG|nr:hypothetical protein DSO57_1024591 [Entomophthora muscae]
MKRVMATSLVGPLLHRSPPSQASSSRPRSLSRVPHPLSPLCSLFSWCPIVGCCLSSPSSSGCLPVSAFSEPASSFAGAPSGAPSVSALVLPSGSPSSLLLPSLLPAASPAAPSKCGASPGLLAGVLNSESGQSSLVCAYSTRHVVLSSLDEEDTLSGVDRPSPSHQTPKRKGTQRGQVGAKRHQLNAQGYEVVAGKHVPYQTQQQAFSDDSNQPSIALLQSLNFQLPPPPSQ